MPEYLYQSPDGKETVSVIQRMNEPHSYSKDGVEWIRIFTIPQSSIDAKIDPFSSKDFVEKTGKKRGTLGNIADASKEASLERERILGKDPLKEEFYARYSEKRGGKAHPNTVKKDITIEF